MTVGLDKSVEASLSTAGVPKAFRKVSLTSFGSAGERMVSDIKEIGFKDKVEHEGLGYITCDGNVATDGDILKVFAKNLVCFARVETLVIYMEDFAKACAEYDMDYFSYLKEFTAIVIPSFHRVRYEKYPCGDELFYTIEQRLSQLMDAEVSVSIHFQTRLKNNVWFSDWFMQKLQGKNRVIEL